MLDFSPFALTIINGMSYTIYEIFVTHLDSYNPQVNYPRYRSPIIFKVQLHQLDQSLEGPISIVGEGCEKYQKNLAH